VLTRIQHWKHPLTLSDNLVREKSAALVAQRCASAGVPALGVPSLRAARAKSAHAHEDWFAAVRIRVRSVCGSSATVFARLVGWVAVLDLDRSFCGERYD